ncbi:2-hydroxyacid dehydrogenase [Methylobacterium sp. WL64]|nr:2-hydroxyacid dehydrogenase [Methylobacterium sp. WL64]
MFDVKPTLLLFTESAERMLDGALADRFEILRLWEGDDPDDIIAARGADVIVTLTLRLDASLLDRLPNLRLIVVPGAGYEHVDVVAARARGVTVANAGNTHSGDVADHALALVLASVHRLPEMQAWVSNGRWLTASPPERRHAMSAQRFGLVGLGNIGNAIAERLTPFGGEIAWWGPRAKPATWPRRESLIDLARWCTALIVATRGDAAGLIDAKTIAAVGPKGLIVNISRGAVIDEDALIAALKDGSLGRAALDVFAQEPAAPERWRDAPNVILTPHVGGVSQEATERLRHAAIRNLASVVDGTPVVNEITA